MEVPIADIPDFSKGADHWLQAMEKWLWQQGIALVVAVPECYPPNCYYMAWGQSPRGYEHSVLYYNGELAHDPHPDNTGLVQVEDIAYCVLRFTKPR